MPSIEELIRRKNDVEAQFLAMPGVTAVDVGYKEVGGVLTDRLAIRVHVQKKGGRIPADQRVPAEVDGIVTDVLERTYELQVAEQAIDVTAMADTTHYATLQGGVSMGPSRVINGSIFAGTLGAIVVDNTTNTHVALTNFHVACVDAGWHVGDRMVQPSRIDTGTVPTDEFGAIVRATLSANVDGALISIDSGRANACTIAEIGNVAGTKVATLGANVRKRGRTTGLTYGSIDGISATVNVNYGSTIGVRTLSNQVSVRADTTRNPLFSDHGDSGSVIVDDQGFVVALLFAGSGTSTIGNPIAAVLAELNISMCVTPQKSLLKEHVKDGKELLKDNRKDFIKDNRKDFIKDKDKDKEISKDLIKDKDIRKDVKDKDIIEGPGKAIIDTPRKRIGDTIPHPGGGDPGPIVPGLPGGGLPGGGVQSAPSALEQRLAALEEQLGALTSFIASDLRPDLTGGAFSGEPDAGAGELAAMRAALEQQASDAAAAKADFDNRWR
jgi:hypothetical protein